MFDATDIGLAGIAMASEALEMPASFDAKMTNFRCRLSSIRGQVSVPKVVFLASIRPTLHMNGFI